MKRLHDGRRARSSPAPTRRRASTCFPGFSLHQELQRFVDAGFTPHGGAADGDDQPGEVPRPGRPTSAPSRRARSPTSSCSTRIRSSDIRNTRKIAAVVANGRYYPREKLDGILADVEAYAASH